MSDVRVWRYHLPSIKGEGWVIAFLDSIGAFSCLSDWGDYGYRWPQAGWGPGDFRQFFVQCHDDYVLHKIARRDTYHSDRTLRNVKDHILSHRRDLCWSRQWARDEWNLLTRHSNLYSREDFAFWYQDTKIADVGELSVYDVSDQARGFIEHAMPRLREAIKAELAAEGLAA
jgi:hypothetical protein